MNDTVVYLGFILPTNGLVSRVELKKAVVELDDKLNRGVFGVARNDKDEYNLALYTVVLMNPEMFDVRMHYKNEIAYCSKPQGDKLHTTYKNLHRIYHGHNEISREEFIRQMGKLFGYSPESTKEFIESGVPYKCGCRLCGGADL